MGMVLIAARRARLIAMSIPSARETLQLVKTHFSQNRHSSQPNGCSPHAPRNNDTSSTAAAEACRRWPVADGRRSRRSRRKTAAANLTTPPASGIHRPFPAPIPSGYGHQLHRCRRGASMVACDRWDEGAHTRCPGKVHAVRRECVGCDLPERMRRTLSKTVHTHHQPCLFNPLPGARYFLEQPAAAVMIQGAGSAGRCSEAIA